MRNELIESITYIALIYGIWTVGITALVAYLAKKNRRYLWIIYGVTMALLTFFIAGIIVALASRL